MNHDIEATSSSDTTYKARLLPSVRPNQSPFEKRRGSKTGASANNFASPQNSTQSSHKNTSRRTHRNKQHTRRRKPRDTIKRMGSAPENHSTVTHRGAAGSQFPGKLHDLMTYTERQGLEHIISWVQSGHAIMVHDPAKLLEILPLFGFGQTKYRSFQRQLNMWHWERIVEGPFKGGWKHPYFLRGNKLLCSYMSRRMMCDPSVPPELLVKPQSQNQHEMSNAIKTNLSVPVVPSCDKLMGAPSSMKWVSFRPSSPISSFSASSSLLCFGKGMDDEDEFAPLPISTNGTFLGFQSFSKQDLSSLDPTPIREPKFDYLAAPSIQFQTIHALSEPLPPDAFDDLF